MIVPPIISEIVTGSARPIMYLTESGCRSEWPRSPCTTMRSRKWTYWYGSEWPWRFHCVWRSGATRPWREAAVFGIARKMTKVMSEMTASSTTVHASRLTT